MEVNIKQNKHWSNKGLLLGFTCKNYIEGTITLLEGFDYINRNSDDKDTNKIIGLSDNLYHIWDSTRIGWNNYDKLYLSAFNHINSQHYTEPLLAVEMNKEYYFKIDILNNYYSTTINNVNFKQKRESNWFGPRYILPSYYGGQNKAINNFKLDINY